jgi:hypothetical protein
MCRELGVPAGLERSRSGNGNMTDRTGRIDVAVMQSLHRKEDVKDFIAE